MVIIKIVGQDGSDFRVFNNGHLQSLEVKPAMKKNTMKGDGFTEYALILALVAVAVILVLVLTGTSIKDLYCSVTDALNFKGGSTCNNLLLDGFGKTADWTKFWGGGTWTLANGQLCTAGDMRILNKAALPNDYNINLNGATLNSGNGYGTLFRMAKNGTGYSGYGFMVDPGLNNQFVFRKYTTNGVEIDPPLAALKFPPGFNPGVNHDISVNVVGSTFTAYVDGVKMLTANDSTYTSGQVGIRSIVNANACINGMTVTAP